MDEMESLSHTKWERKYHVVFIPKWRRKVLYGELRRHLGEVFRRLSEQKESRIDEGHLMPDHVHRMIAIPPKYAVSQVMDVLQLLGLLAGDVKQSRNDKSTGDLQMAAGRTRPHPSRRPKEVTHIE